MLGQAFEPEEKYENPDGTPICFNTDYFGAERNSSPCAGPVEPGCITDEGKSLMLMKKSFSHERR